MDKYIFSFINSNRLWKKVAVRCKPNLKLANLHRICELINFEYEVFEKYLLSILNSLFAEELDLTGSPLKLDLSLHTILDDTMISDEPQLWTKEEALHYPLSIEKAR